MADADASFQYVNWFCFDVISTPSANEVSASLCADDARCRQLTTPRVPVVLSSVVAVGRSVGRRESSRVASQQFILTTYRRGRVLVVNYPTALRNSALGPLLSDNTSRALMSLDVCCVAKRDVRPRRSGPPGQKTSALPPDSDGDRVSTPWLC